MSRNSSSSRRGSRTASKDSKRSRSCGEEVKVALEETSLEKSLERKAQDFMKFLENEQIPETIENTEIQDDNENDANENIGDEINSHQEVFNDSHARGNSSQSTSLIDVKMSASFTSKRGGSSIPLLVRTIPSVKSSSRQPSPRPVSLVSSNQTVSKSKMESGKTEVNLISKLPPTRRSLEIQFINKKKKLEELRKQLVDKQTPVMDVYQSLVQIKKKLEENGKLVPLDPIKFVVCDSTKVIKQPKPEKQSSADVAAAGESPRIPIKDSVENVKQYLRGMPSGLINICKTLIGKRIELMELLEKSNDPQAMLHLETHRMESRMLDQSISEVIQEQDRLVDDFVNQCMTLSEHEQQTELAAENDALKSKVKMQEKTLVDICEDLQQTQAKFRDQESTIVLLNAKIRELEHALLNEKSQVKETKEKTATVDQKTKAMKIKVKDMENKARAYESKVMELSNHLHQAQVNLEQKEKQWDKERSELTHQRKQDQLIIDKMSKDKAATESRLKAVSELLGDKEGEMRAMSQKYEAEIEKSRKQAMEEKIQKDEMKSKYEGMREELMKMEISNQQAVDVVNNRREMQNENKDQINSMREQELYSELKATQVALKDTQDQLEILAAEKLRFIDSIEKLNEYTEEGKRNVAKAIFKKDEEITNLSNMVREKNEMTKQMNVEIRTLQAKLDYMQAKVGAIQMQQEIDPTAELKEIINEGKMKLEYSLKKSLENEQKVIKYENDLDKQQKTINEMENLLKVRDGLIGMIKLKKDEAVAQNESLSKYAHEMRQLLLEAKEELNLKANLISELTASISKYQETSLKLQKRIKDLENVLSATNEKRYKLQDAIGTMEKELQSTKARMNQMSEMQTRYDDPGMQPYDVRKCNSMPQRIDPLAMYKQYKKAYDKQAKRRVVHKRGPVIRSLGSNTSLASKHNARRRSPTGRCKNDDFSEGRFLQKQNETYDGEVIKQQTNVRMCNACDTPTRLLGDLPRTPMWTQLKPIRSQVTHVQATHAEGSHIQTTHPHTTQGRHTQGAHAQETHKQAHIQQTHIQQAHIQQAHSQQSHSQEAHINQTHAQQAHTQHAHTPQAHTPQAHTQTYTQQTFTQQTHAQQTPSMLQDMPIRSHINYPDSNKHLISMAKASQILRDRDHLKNVHPLSKYDKCNERGKVFQTEINPYVCNNINRYKITDTGTVLWCKSTSFAKLNNLVMQQHDLIENSCNKVRNGINNSLQLIEENSSKASNFRREGARHKFLR